MFINKIKFALKSSFVFTEVIRIHTYIYIFRLKEILPYFSSTNYSIFFTFSGRRIILIPPNALPFSVVLHYYLCDTGFYAYEYD